MLDCDGNAVRALEPSELVIVNDATGKSFNDSSEGGSASPLQVNSAIEQYSILVLDLSNSIVNNRRLPDVLAGARTFVKQVVQDAPTRELRHHVAILGFGSTANTQLLQGFTQDDQELYATLDGLADEPGRGTTNLYGAYTLGLSELAAQGGERTDVERFLVLLTDGTHEAGDEEAQRAQALAAKHATSATIFTLGVQGDYDACRLEELAGRGGSSMSACEAGGCNTGNPCEEFVSVQEVEQLSSTFGAVSERALAIARSNYRLGVCTPVELGEASLTLQIAMTSGGYTASTSAQLSYLTDALTGDVSACDAAAIADEPLSCDEQTVCSVGCPAGGCQGDGDGDSPDGGSGSAECPSTYVCGVIPFSQTTACLAELAVPPCGPDCEAWGGECMPLPPISNDACVIPCTP